MSILGHRHRYRRVFLTPLFSTGALPPSRLLTLTILTQPPELELMVKNLKSRSPGYLSIQLRVNRLIDIKYPATPLASKMIVALPLCFESTLISIKIKLCYLPVFPQHS